MSRLDYLREDDKGYYLDYSGVFFKMEIFEGLTIKVTVCDDEWYCLNDFIKKLGKKKTASTLAKQINKIEDGSAVRIALFSKHKMWYVNEQGLHLATDLLISLTNDLKLSIL